MKMIISSRLLFFCCLLILLSGCSQPEIVKGVVGNYYSVSVKAPLGVENPEFEWRIVEIPENSQLSFSDLTVAENSDEMAFQPDETGNYSFGLTVYTAEGEEVASQTYTFNIEAPAPRSEEKLETVIKETVVSEKPPDVQLTEEPESIEEVHPDIDTVSLVVSEIEKEIVPEPIRSDVQHRGDKKTQKLPDSQPQPASRGQKIPKVEGKLTIQVSSWPDLKEAQTELEELQDLGLDAYIQKTYFEETGEIWYRVRIGSFLEMEIAKQAASEISSILNLNTWVDHIRVDVKINEEDN